MKTPRCTRAQFARFVFVTTRWMDNDVYGHVNNAVYYSYFDTAVNQLLLQAGVLEVKTSPLIGLVVETQCRYHEPIAFPDEIEAGVHVAHVGNSSVRYCLGLFRRESDTAAAEGHFVHVYVDRHDRRPRPLGEPLRRFVESMLMPDLVS